MLIHVIVHLYVCLKLLVDIGQKFAEYNYSDIMSCNILNVVLICSTLIYACSLAGVIFVSSFIINTYHLTISQY